MFLPWAPLHNPLVQLALSIPVYSLGLWFFGKSAFHSLRSGVPNMDVLIFMGAAASFFYSIFGTFYYYNSPEMHNYLFYETGASIISLVLFGNLLEKRAVKKTTNAIQSLSNLQVKTAKLMIEVGGVWQIKEVEVAQLQLGNRLQINNGDIVPIDAIVVSGDAECDEQMMSGETMPVHKKMGDKVIGGTHLLNGNLQVEVSTSLRESTLSQIIEMVKKAQGSKPSIQKLGDQVSAVFVPIVISISLLTFFISYFWLNLGSAQSMLRAVAVLVISCPCAMGLATPTAIMVGIGKAAKRGILIKGGEVLENFAKNKKIIFDKTGTLSTGQFIFTDFWFEPSQEKEVKEMIFEIESHSSHPIAKALVAAYPNWKGTQTYFKGIEEIKGAGMYAHTEDALLYKIASAKHLEIADDSYDLYFVKGTEIIAKWNMSDEMKVGAIELMAYFKKQNVETILLSGDRKKKVLQVSNLLGISEGKYEQNPAQKLAYIEQQSLLEPLVMVGDGVNDAPALSKVSVGVSFAKGSDIAIKAANLVLMRSDLMALQEAHLISKLTYKTIKQNLFWAFFYNAICIPLAAAGYMHPMMGALSMAFSDVIVIGNSLLLNIKKIKAD